MIFAYLVLISLLIVSSDAFIGERGCAVRPNGFFTTPSDFKPLHSSHDDDNIPSSITSTVLRQVYPAMMKHLEQYGNPNIPLGSIDGKRCKTLRRLAFEEKLTDKEISFLQGINFRFNSMEEVYEEADFDECLARLILYEKEYETGFQIPKKYKPDPELGAWVAVIRRLGREKIGPDRRDKLNAIGFAWTSLRKCGSSFMSNYRNVKAKLDQAVADSEDLNEILRNDVDLKRWISAQRQAAENGNLSEARCDYMDQLPVNWKHI